MNPRSRLRKTTKWGGLAATVPLAAVWIGSVRWSGVYVIQSGALIGTDGSALCWRGALPTGVHVPPGFSWGREAGRLNWLLFVDVSMGLRYYYIPLWIPFALACIPTVIMWRNDRRLSGCTRPDLCDACGYDRRGLAPDAVCPECGVAPLPRQPLTSSPPHSG